MCIVLFAFIFFVKDTNNNNNNDENLEGLLEVWCENVEQKEEWKKALIKVEIDNINGLRERAEGCQWQNTLDNIEQQRLVDELCIWYTDRYRGKGIN